MTRACGAALAVLSFAAFAPLAAQQTQVGRLPENSPFRDVEFTHEFTIFTGYMSAAGDPAGVSPAGGPLLGARYDFHATGPLFLYARVAEEFTDRLARDPTRQPGKREIGRFGWPLTFADVGLSVSFTGEKSWKRFQPMASIGAGVVSDWMTAPDRGGYTFGTTFLFTMGAGFRYTPDRRWQYRVEMLDYMNEISYPTTYTDTPPGGAAGLLPAGSSRGVWRHSWNLQIGAAYTFLR
jgi:hypothetical protein